MKRALIVKRETPEKCARRPRECDFFRPSSPRVQGTPPRGPRGC